ncbi:hypothetical protein DFH06DRAFT_1134954 [Mycena polygramma]|nr:hypothetical protein DFH06DRAFT_1134954 [Mycena polygramma]
MHKLMTHQLPSLLSSTTSTARISSVPRPNAPGFGQYPPRMQHMDLTPYEYLPSSRADGTRVPSLGTFVGPKKLYFRSCCSQDKTDWPWMDLGTSLLDIGLNLNARITGHLSAIPSGATPRAVQQFERGAEGRMTVQFSSHGRRVAAHSDTPQIALRGVHSEYGACGCAPVRRWRFVHWYVLLYGIF